MKKLHRTAPTSGQISCFISVLVYSLLFVAVNFYWLLSYRLGSVLDIDEAGYMSYAVNLAHAFEGGGVLNWLNVFTYPNPQAPFTIAVASLLMVASGQNEVAGLFTNSLIGIALLIVVFILGSRVYNRSTGLIATILVGTNPYIIDYTRQFQFATAASLFFVGSVYCYWRSDSLKNVGWIAALGGCAALMVLSRTMTIAFLPAMGILFLADSIKRGTALKTTLVAVATALLVFVLVSGPWFLVNAKGVFGYLFSFGYGQHAAEYGTTPGVFTIGNITARLIILLSRVMLLHALIIGTGTILLLVFILAGRTKENGRYSFAGLALTLVGLCYLILLSSKNEGSSFEMPLIPLLTVALTGGISQSIPSRVIRRALAGIAIVVCVIGFAPTIDRNTCEVVNERLASSNVFVPFYSYCGGGIQLYVQQWGKRDPVGPKLAFTKAIPKETLKGWSDVSVVLANILADRKLAKQGVAFAARHILVNVNTVSLNLVKTTGAFLPVAQIEPSIVPRTVEGYKSWLAGADVASGCYIVALNSNDGEFEPSADPVLLRQALDEMGYRLVDAVGTPTPGQKFMLFQSSVKHCSG